MNGENGDRADTRERGRLVPKHGLDRFCVR
jgi:hypothetical protein